MKIILLFCQILRFDYFLFQQLSNPITSAIHSIKIESRAIKR